MLYNESKWNRKWSPDFKHCDRNEKRTLVVFCGGKVELMSQRSVKICLER